MEAGTSQFYITESVVEEKIVDKARTHVINGGKARVHYHDFAGECDDRCYLLAEVVPGSRGTE